MRSRPSFGAGRRRRTLLAAAVLFPSVAVAADPGPSASIGIDEAVHLALTAGPDVAVAQQAVAVQRAALSGAEVFPTNPSLSIGAGGRYSFADGPGVDGDIGVSQALPLFGRWGAGVDAAAAGVTAAGAEVWAGRTRLASAVALAFVAAQRAGGQLAVAERRITLVEKLVDTAHRRLNAGDGTILDVNLWEAELGQAEAQQARLKVMDATARTRLALLCGLDPSNPPTALGDLNEDTLSGWVAEPAERADLAARAKRIEQAERVTDREEREAWPDVTLNAGAQTEGAWWRNGPAGDVVGGAGVTVPLPLFDRNQAGVLRARANTGALQADLARAQLVADAEVAVARAQLAAFEEAADTLKTRVKGKQHATLELLEKALRAGKLGVAAILLRQRFVLHAEASYVDALADVAAARVRLAFASGALSHRIATLMASADPTGGSR